MLKPGDKAKDFTLMSDKDECNSAIMIRKLTCI